jgi:hypothetical protein
MRYVREFLALKGSPTRTLWVARGVSPAEQAVRHHEPEARDAQIRDRRRRAEGALTVRATLFVVQSTLHAEQSAVPTRPAIRLARTRARFAEPTIPCDVTRGRKPETSTLQARRSALQRVPCMPLAVQRGRHPQHGRRDELRTAPAAQPSTALRMRSAWLVVQSGSFVVQTGLLVVQTGYVAERSARLRVPRALHGVRSTRVRVPCPMNAARCSLHARERPPFAVQSTLQAGPTTRERVRSRSLRVQCTAFGQTRSRRAQMNTWQSEQNRLHAVPPSLHGEQSCLYDEQTSHALEREGK